MPGTTNNHTSKGHWYCKRCMIEVNPENITPDGLHKDCGGKTEWVEPVCVGIFFREPQEAFYRLTGKKPLIIATHGGKNIVTANEEYLVFLEKNYMGNKSQ